MRVNMWFSEMMIVNHIKVNHIKVLSNERCLRLFNYYLIHFKFSKLSFHSQISLELSSG